MESEPSIMRCLGQAAGEIIRAVKTPVDAPATDGSRVISRQCAEARVGDVLLRRTVTDEVVSAQAPSASNPYPCA